MINSLLGPMIDSKILDMPDSLKNSSSEANLPLIKLIGDARENFYQLGLADRETFLPLKNHLSSLIKTPWPPLNKVIKEIGQLYLRQGPKHSPEFYKNVSSYAEGLGINYAEMALTLLIPEYLSFVTKWLPGLKTTLFGCSSYFYWDEHFNSPVHGRVLDFPMAASYARSERAILYKFKGLPQMVSLSTSGFPYPGLTTMTDAGLTFALHQKFTNKFCHLGTPIFELIYQMLAKTGDKKSILDFLKKSKSLTTWGLYISCKNGDILAIDMMGDELYYKEYKLAPGEILSFNNMPEAPAMRKKTLARDFIPYGITDYCSMRETMGAKKIEKLKKIPKLNDEKFLEIIATPILKKQESAEDWKLDPITPSTLTISTMNAQSGKFLYVDGPAPKYYRGKFFEFKEIWDEPISKHHTKRGKFTPADYAEGMRELITAQTCFDKGDNAHIYHHLQMAKDYLHEYPESTIADFYFHVFQYIFETHKKVQGTLLENFLALRGKLPFYLAQHNYLFINRLEIILGRERHEQTVHSEHFEVHHLKEINRLENKIPRPLLHKATAPLINPRIEILDIIYAHIRSR